jgi:ATP-dependent Clp protease ATP-binding subunit ClpC
MEALSNPEHEDHCSFCDRPTSQVGPLARGTGGASICATCVQRLFYEQRPGTVSGSFDRFTERARAVLTLAAEEARRLNHNYIGTEHLLLGLVREGEGVAAKVLSNLGIELATVRSAVEHVIGRGERQPMGEIGLTPRAKKVIALAIDEARRLKHQYIGTEHLLLGLVREGEGIGAVVLESLGARLEMTRSEVIKVLALPGEASDR